MKSRPGSAAGAAWVHWIRPAPPGTFCRAECKTLFNRSTRDNGGHLTMSEPEKRPAPETTDDDDAPLKKLKVRVSSDPDSG